ncbi:hypothetical protein TSMEX_002742 [Taenia solium]|eukprot:TsM_000292800 transcript=TsM_000292800 gene=TsM_000292800
MRWPAPSILSLSTVFRKEEVPDPLELLRGIDDVAVEYQLISMEIR